MFTTVLYLAVYYYLAAYCAAYSWYRSLKFSNTPITDFQDGNFKVSS